MTTSGTSVVVVQPQEMFRVGVRAILQATPLMRVVGEGATAAEAIDRCRATRPDAVLTEIRLPDSDDGRHIARLREVSPRSAIVVLSDVGDPGVVLAALHAGARAYLLKGAASTDLAQAIDRAVAGHAFVDSSLAGEILVALATDSGSRGPAAMPEPLTPREVDVLREIATGRSNKEIAHRLEVAAGTVKVHIARILAKLGAANRAEASIRGVQLGLVDPGGVDDPRPSGLSSLR
jgi:DNA-binding NarL/FixJ family response regulator